MAQTQHVISGVVRNPQGNPVPLARVYFTSGPAPLPDIAALTNNEGQFSLSVPSKGAYTIESMADGFAPASVTVTVTGNQETRVEIKLRT